MKMRLRWFTLFSLMSEVLQFINAKARVEKLSALSSSVSEVKKISNGKTSSDLSTQTDNKGFISSSLAVSRIISPFTVSSRKEQSSNTGAAAVKEDSNLSSDKVISVNQIETTVVRNKDSTRVFSPSSTPASQNRDELQRTAERVSEISDSDKDSGRGELKGFPENNFINTRKQETPTHKFVFERIRTDNSEKDQKEAQKLKTSLALTSAEQQIQNQKLETDGIKALENSRFKTFKNIQFSKQNPNAQTAELVNRFQNLQDPIFADADFKHYNQSKPEKNASGTDFKHYNQSKPEENAETSEVTEQTGIMAKNNEHSDLVGETRFNNFSQIKIQTNKPSEGVQMMETAKTTEAGMNRIEQENAQLENIKLLKNVSSGMNERLDVRAEANTTGLGKENASIPEMTTKTDLSEADNITKALGIGKIEPSHEKKFMPTIQNNIESSDTSVKNEKDKMVKEEKENDTLNFIPTSFPSTSNKSYDDDEQKVNPKRPGLGEGDKSSSNLTHHAEEDYMRGISKQNFSQYDAVQQRLDQNNDTYDDFRLSNTSHLNNDSDILHKSELHNLTSAKLKTDEQYVNDNNRSHQGRYGEAGHLEGGHEDRKELKNENATARPKTEMGMDAEVKAEREDRRMSQKKPERIIGGTWRMLFDYPYVAMSITRLNHLAMARCSATILTEFYVLSCAHCYFDGSEVVIPSRIMIRAGSRYTDLHYQDPQTQTRIAREIVIYPGYSPYSFDAMIKDLAIVKLREAFDFNTYVKRVSIYTKPVEPEEYMLCKITGWGYDQGRYTKYVQEYFKFIEQYVAYNWKFCPCLHWGTYGGLLCGERNGTESMCHGDYGGPLLCKDKKIVGVTQGLVSTNCEKPTVLEDDDCEDEDKVAVVIYLCPHFDWLRNFVEEIPVRPEACKFPIPGGEYKASAPRHIWWLSTCVSSFPPFAVFVFSLILVRIS